MRNFIQIDEMPECQVFNLTYSDKSYRLKLNHLTIDQEQKCECERPVNEHKHQDLYHIVLYTDGDNEFSFNGKRFRAQRGVLAITSPGEPHGFKSLRKGTAFYSEITFALEGKSGTYLNISFKQFLSLFAGMELIAPSFPLKLNEPQVEEAKTRFTGIQKWLKTPGNLSNMFATKGFSDLIIFLIRECFTPIFTQNNLAQDHLRKVREHIEYHYTEGLSVSRLAKMACLSKGHFLRSFKNEFAVSPIAYQQLLRVRAAKTLLKSSELRCKEIASQTGYEDIHYFSKVFKKVSGISPTEYRRSTQTSL